MEEERCYTVYMHVCKETNKTYVGLTRRNPEIRWQNGTGYRQNKYFDNAIKKYTWDGFEHIILFENKTKEEAEILEVLYIKVLLSNNRLYGYNIANGGNSKGVHSEETKKKMSELRKGFKASKETKIKLSKQRQRGKHPLAKKVMCEGKIFECAKDCTDYYNIPYETMINWLNGTNGMPQEYYDMRLYYVGEQDKIRLSADRIGVNNPNSKKVYCDGKIFDCVNDCAEYYGINYNVLGGWLRGTHGMPQEFFNMNLKYVDESYATKMHIDQVKGNCPSAKKVICDGKIYGTLMECAEAYNINSGTMGCWLRGENKMPQQFIDIGLKYVDSDIIIEPQKGLEGINGKQVVCDNKTFISISNCAEYYNIITATMNGWLLGKHKMPQDFINLGLRYLNGRCDYKSQNEEQTHLSKKVICDNILFNSITKCAKYYGVDRRTMNDWVLGNYKMPQKFIEMGLDYYIENNK